MHMITQIEKVYVRSGDFRIDPTSELDQFYIVVDLFLIYSFVFSNFDDYFVAWYASNHNGTPYERFPTSDDN